MRSKQPLLLKWKAVAWCRSTAIASHSAQLAVSITPRLFPSPGRRGLALAFQL